MTIRECIARWLYRRAHDSTLMREPDFIIGSANNPYLYRWFVIPRNRIFNIYLHYFMRSDDDRALHDHPWWNLSFLLKGRYVEHTIPAGGVNVRKEYQSGDFKFRFAKAAHRIELIDGPCWTLFITGPRVRDWGFHCPLGWKRWQDFTNPNNSGEIGPGCDDAIRPRKDSSLMVGSSRASDSLMIKKQNQPNENSLAFNKTPSEHAGPSG